MILLLRHGRTEANAQRLLLGRSDPGLDAEGLRQAEALAAVVAATATGVDHVVSSPLQRCRRTAEAVARALGVPVVVDDRWVELDYGELDRVPMAAVPVQTWAAWQADPAWAPPGGESLAALGERVRVACDQLAPPADGGGSTSGAHGDQVVVSHVSPIKAAVAWALGVGDEVAWRMFLSPGSITRIRTHPTRSLVSFNETAHL